LELSVKLQTRVVLERSQRKVALFFRAIGHRGVTKEVIFGAVNRVFLKVFQKFNYAANRAIGALLFSGTRARAC